jgi:hypothetical protein
MAFLTMEDSSCGYGTQETPLRSALSLQFGWFLRFVHPFLEGP